MNSRERLNPNDLLGKNGFGIPKKIFDKNEFHGEVMCGSGGIIDVQITPMEVHIHAKNSEYPILRTQVERDCLFTAVYSRIRGVSLHPDFYPREILSATIRFHLRICKINTMFGRWNYDQFAKSTNFDQYFDFLAEYGKSKDVMISAANNTWTGKIYREFGFVARDEPEYIYKDGQLSSVIARFRK